MPGLKEGDKLTHGAGVVFCSFKSPIKRVKELAKDLAEEAKKKSRKEDGFAVAFLESVELVRFYASQSLAGGYLAYRFQPNKPYRPFFLTDTGSVFLLKVKDQGVADTCLDDRATKTAIPQRLFHTEFVSAGIAFKIVIDGQNLSDGEVAVLLAALEGFNDQHDPVRLGGMAGHDWGRCKWESGPVSRIEREEVKAEVEKSRKAKQALPIGFALCRPINVNAIRG